MPALLDDETLIPLSDAPVPGSPNPAKLARWARFGVRGTKLETVVVGGRRYTSPAAVRRFIERLNASEASR